jgi:hypothetical protein
MPPAMRIRCKINILVATLLEGAQIFDSLSDER